MTKAIVDNSDNCMDRFEIEATSEWILANAFERVGLQFTDELLGDSIEVCLALSDKCQAECYILADTSYAGCCIDPLPGQRLNIDALIHYGRACLTPCNDESNKLPVYYVFSPTSPLSPLPCNYQQLIIDRLHQLQQSSESDSSTITNFLLVITYDFRYRNLARQVYDGLLGHLPSNQWSLCWSEPLFPASASSSSPVYSSATNDVIFQRCNRTFYPTRSFNSNDGPGESSCPQQSTWFLLHITDLTSDRYPSTTNSPDLLSFYRIAIGFPEVDPCHTLLLNLRGSDDKVPNNCLQSGLDCLDRLIKQRYSLIEKARSARNIGILIGTLSASQYDQVIDRLLTLIETRQSADDPVRHCFLLNVGRLNSAKLCNLPELDAMVLVACPDSSLVNLREECFVPVLTPWELERALTPLSEWQFDGQQLITEFDRLLLSPLPSGALTNNDQKSSPASNSTVDIRSDRWTVAQCSSRPKFFTRTWFGLDPQIGQTSDCAETIEPGQTGLPTGYRQL